MVHPYSESDPRPRRGLHGGLAALMLTLSVLVVTAAPAAASQQYQTTDNVVLRSGPGTGYSQVGSLANGSTITVVCQAQGGTNVGGNATWDRLDSGSWVTDFYTTSPSFNSYAPGLGACDTGSTRTSIGYNPFAANYSDQCTYYAEERMHQQTGLYMPVYGNAYEWADQARSAGWSVGSSPAVNSVVVFPAGSFGSDVGHVGWTVEVSGNQVRIQDCNWNWVGAQVTDHWVTMPPGTQFIYS
jgi:surface antigen